MYSPHVTADGQAKTLDILIYRVRMLFWNKSGPKVIKLFSCSTQLSIKFILLINVKMPTIVGILTFISRINIYNLSILSRIN